MSELAGRHPPTQESDKGRLGKGSPKSQVIPVNTKGSDTAPLDSQVRKSALSVPALTF